MNTSDAVVKALATRIGDIERNACVEKLTEARALGMLSADEFDERVDRAWAARVRADLDVLTVDLPVAPKQRKAIGRSTHDRTRTAGLITWRWGVPAGAVSVMSLWTASEVQSDAAGLASLATGVAGIVLARLTGLKRNR